MIEIECSYRSTTAMLLAVLVLSLQLAFANNITAAWKCLSVAATVQLSTTRPLSWLTPWLWGCLLAVATFLCFGGARYVVVVY